MAFGVRPGGRGSLFGAPGTGIAERALDRGLGYSGWAPGGGTQGTGYQTPYLPLVGWPGLGPAAGMTPGQRAYNRWMAQAPGWDFGGGSTQLGGAQPAGWQVPMAPGVVVPQAGQGWHPPLAVGVEDTGLPGGPGTGGGVWETEPAGGAGGARGGGEGRTAPPGVDENWWRRFAEEHGGQTPLEYYGAQGEGLGEAMGDLEWSQDFEEMYGRPPNDDDWRAWWFQKRGMLTPEEIDRRWRQWVENQITTKQVEEPEERPPLWVPPFISWR